jgi:hypothetical protein
MKGPTYLTGLPGPCALPLCLRAVTAIASRPEVIEIESKVWTNLNWNLMVGVKVAFAAVVAISQLGQHSICGRIAELEPAEVSDNIRLPTAIHTPPTIALEAEDPQPTVVRIVSAVTA